MSEVSDLVATTDAQRDALDDADYVESTAGTASPEWTTALGVLAAHFPAAVARFDAALDRRCNEGIARSAEHRNVVVRALRRRGYLKETIRVARRGYTTLEAAADCARALGDLGTSLTLRLQAAQTRGGDTDTARRWFGVAADAAAPGPQAAAAEAKALGEVPLGRLTAKAIDPPSQLQLRALLAQIEGGAEGLAQTLAVLAEIGDDDNVRSTSTGRSASAYAVARLVEAGDLEQARAIQERLYVALAKANLGVPEYEAAEDLIALRIRLGERDAVKKEWSPLYRKLVRDFAEDGESHWHCRFIRRVIDGYPVV